MGSIINARISHQVEQKLADYCARHWVTRTEAVTRALDHLLDQESGGTSRYSHYVVVVVHGKALQPPGRFEGRAPTTAVLSLAGRFPGPAHI